MVQVAYAIGVADPVSIMVETFGTGKVPNASLEQLIRRHFDFTPAGHHQVPGPPPPDLPEDGRLRPLRAERARVHLGAHEPREGPPRGRGDLARGAEPMTSTPHDVKDLSLAAAGQLASPRSISSGTGPPRAESVPRPDPDRPGHRPAQARVHGRQDRRAHPAAAGVPGVLDPRDLGRVPPPRWMPAPAEPRRRRRRRLWGCSPSSWSSGSASATVPSRPWDPWWRAPAGRRLPTCPSTPPSSTCTRAIPTTAGAASRRWRPQRAGPASAWSSSPTTTPSRPWPRTRRGGTARCWSSSEPRSRPAPGISWSSTRARTCRRVRVDSRSTSWSAATGRPGPSCSWRIPSTPGSDGAMPCRRSMASRSSMSSTS